MSTQSSSADLLDYIRDTCAILMLRAQDQGLTDVAFALSLAARSAFEASLSVTSEPASASSRVRHDEEAEAA